jgi:hypothetical protein
VVDLLGAEVHVCCQETEDVGLVPFRAHLPQIILKNNIK